MDNHYKKIINNIEEVFREYPIEKQIAVAVSGGCDSLALLLAINEFCQNKNIKIFALTIDHKMRPSSSVEAQKLQSLLKNYVVEHHILEIPHHLVPSNNIEANLRDLRYEILLNFCNNYHIKHLFVGHHLGDVAENFLIRLFRGSGLDGLSPIQKMIEQSGVKILRPFLTINKELLQDFLRYKNIDWFEDETNQDEKFLRNKIRKFLASFSDKNIIENRIYSASQEIAKARELFDEIMRRKESQILTPIADYFIIDLIKMRRVKPLIAHKILALLLTKISEKNYKPRKEKLLRFYEYLMAEDHLHSKIKKREFYGCVVENYGIGKVKIYKKIADL